MRRPAPLARPRFLNFPSYDWLSETSIMCLGVAAGADGARELSIKVHSGITVLIGRNVHRSQRTASGVFRLASARRGPASPSNPSEGLRQREAPSHARLSRAVIGSRSCQSKQRARLLCGPAPSRERAPIGWAPRLSAPAATPTVTSPCGHVARRARSPRGSRSLPGVSVPQPRPGLVHGQVDLRSRALHRLALWGKQGLRGRHRSHPGRFPPAVRPRGGCGRARLPGQHRPPRLRPPAPAVPAGVSPPPPARAGARPASSGRAGRRCAPAPCGSPPTPAAAAGPGSGQHRWGRGTASVSLSHTSATPGDARVLACHPSRPCLPSSVTQPLVTAPSRRAGVKAGGNATRSCPLPRDRVGLGDARSGQQPAQQQSSAADSRGVIPSLGK